MLDYVTVHDAGRLLNPLIVDGQVQGGFAHGAGAALFERMSYDEDGTLLTGTFMDYLVPSAPDLPPLRIGHRETPSPFTALGAKGLGEGNTMSAPGRDRERRRRRARRRRRRAAADPAARLGAARAVKPAPFRYERPDTVEEAAALLAEHGDEAKVLAGGQSLVPVLNMRLLRPAVLVDVNRVVGARPGSTASAWARRCARTTSAATRSSREALPYVGHFVTRNRGTVGGSIAHADASAELPLCLLVLGGTIVVEGPNGRREISPEEFFVTHYFTTALEPDELVVETIWPAGGRVAFEEFALRHGDFALSMCACSVQIEDGIVRAARVGVGSVVDRPTLLELGLVAQRPPVGDAREAGATPASLVDPPGHLHASPAYLKHLTGVVVERALRRSWTSS